MKIKSLLVAVMLACFSFVASAQYNHSIGAVVGSYDGLSYKGNFGSSFGISADLAVKLTRGAFDDFSLDVYTFELNPNAMWQPSLGPGNFLVGGGLSLGYCFNQVVDLGKFGVNALVGYEYVFSGVPLALQFDFRPGLGLLFDDSDDEEYFDWGLALSLRYTF